MPSYYLLTGAGFTRNWGGWLADEVFEYLLGSQEINEYLRKVLWDAKLQGRGFEYALSLVQDAYASNKSPQNWQHLDAFMKAIIDMFSAMQAAFSFKGLGDKGYVLQRFLDSFDSIFSLNQDTFLESYYAGPVSWGGRWQGSYLPYMKLLQSPEITFPLRGDLTQDLDYKAPENCQPIYKLHGSYNWFVEPEGKRLVVIGGNKTRTIDTFEVLYKYRKEFMEALL
ncbi:MAG TPA: hypothetical protein VEH47_03040, partial [Candidatus Acidoferrales bacterium]|nr:hypothetical protein [Candidatus Acidoferrales bacterium]